MPTQGGWDAAFSHDRHAAEPATAISFIARRLRVLHYQCKGGAPGAACTRTATGRGAAYKGVKSARAFPAFRGTFSTRRGFAPFSHNRRGRACGKVSPMSPLASGLSSHGQKVKICVVVGVVFVWWFFRRAVEGSGVWCGRCRRSVRMCRSRVARGFSGGAWCAGDAAGGS